MLLATFRKLRYEIPSTTGKKRKQDSRKCLVMLLQRFENRKIIQHPELLHVGEVGHRLWLGCSRLRRLRVAHRFFHLLTLETRLSHFEGERRHEAQAQGALQVRRVRPVQGLGRPTESFP